MKKVLSVIMTIGVGLSLCALLAACGEEAHEHNYKTEWTYDESSHWHACDGDCIVVSEKAAHTWDDGEVKTEATADNSGEMTYTCTVCNYKKGEPIEFEGVTEDGWADMIATPSFENYSLHQSSKMEYEGSTMLRQDFIKVTKDKMSVEMREPHNETLVYTGAEAIMQKNSYEEVFLALLADYDKYTYDAEKKVYKNPNPVSVSIDMPMYNASASITMTNGEVSLSEDGKLLKFECDYTQTTVTERGTSTIRTYITWEFSDYGTTVIEDNAQ